MILTADDDDSVLWKRGDVTGIPPVFTRTSTLQKPSYLSDEAWEKLKKRWGLKTHDETQQPPTQARTADAEE